MKAIALIGLLLLGSSACKAPSPRDGSLYEALGREDGIERIVQRLLDLSHEDPRIAPIFDPENRDYLHDRIVEQFCFEAGGPCEYTGLPMDEGHAGMGIRHDEFDLFVQHFITAMEQEGLDTRTQNAMLAIFAPMRQDIIDR